MATVQREIEIARDKDAVWDAIRDVGAIHRRLVPGFVVDCKLDGGSRIVTFANGMVVRELIVAVDDETCRACLVGSRRAFHSSQCVDPGLRAGRREVASGLDRGCDAR